MERKIIAPNAHLQRNMIAPASIPVPLARLCHRFAMDTHRGSPEFTKPTLKISLDYSAKSQTLLDFFVTQVPFSHAAKLPDFADYCPLLPFFVTTHSLASQCAPRAPRLTGNLSTLSPVLATNGSI
jgi:hypothetical protein